MNFEEFKEGFVAVLSRSLDFSTSEESSYLEPGTQLENDLYIPPGQAYQSFQACVYHHEFLLLVSLDLVDSRFVDGT